MKTSLKAYIRIAAAFLLIVACTTGHAIPAYSAPLSLESDNLYTTRQSDSLSEHNSFSPGEPVILFWSTPDRDLQAPDTEPAPKAIKPETTLTVSDQESEAPAEEANAGYQFPENSRKSFTVATKQEEFKVSGTLLYDKASAVFKRVNKERKAAGLSPLEYDTNLQRYAQQRAAEVTVHWAHERPDGSKWHTVGEKIYGENLASGYTTASSVVTAWMGSKGHRRNIIKDGYTKIGVACFEHNGVQYWVQLFGI